MDSVSQPPKPKSPLVTPAPAPAPAPKPEEPNRHINNDPFRWFKAHKRWTAVIIALVVLIPAGILAYFMFFNKPKSATQEQPKSAANEPAKPITSPLTGLVVSAQVAAQPVFGVVIENSPTARPQSGLSGAGVVYEAVAEGGITRFLAIFQDQQPANLGPVRSLRPYFIDWVQEYNNAPIAHAGGSFDALSQVIPSKAKSMNGLTYGSYFRRAGDRPAPHNLYTTTAQLLQLAEKYSWTTPPAFTPWARKADAPEATPSHPEITVTFSSPLYTAKYSYVASCNCYNRAVGGKAHIERNTNAQLQAKNIVVMTIQTSYDKAGHALMTTTGSGAAVVLRDGGAVTGTWKKDSRMGRTKFYDAAGAEIPLNAGNTWVGVIPQTGSVVY